MARMLARTRDMRCCRKVMTPRGTFAYIGGLLVAPRRVRHANRALERAALRRELSAEVPYRRQLR